MESVRVAANPSKELLKSSWLTQSEQRPSSREMIPSHSSSHHAADPADAEPLLSVLEPLEPADPSVHEADETADSHVTSPPPPPVPKRSTINSGPASDLSSSLNFMSDQNYKLLSVPIYGEETVLQFEEEEDILERIHQRESNLFFNKIVSYGILITFIASVITVVVLAVNHTFDHNSSTDDDFSDETCYVSPTCPDVFVTPTYDTTTGFTNYTGWNRHDQYECCNICPTVVVTEPRSAIRSSRSGAVNVNYDYLVFDQIWLPEWCYGLYLGHDSTLSHTIGSQCQEYIYQTQAPRLVVHGLWPNREGTSVACCVSVESKTVTTLNPAAPMSWPFYENLTANWFDPTTNGSYFDRALSESVDCATCYLLNHEWQKHGSCFGSFTLLDDNQYSYFESGLALVDQLAPQTSAINAMHGTRVDRAAIEALYLPFNVHVMCDPQDSDPDDPTVGVFLEVQTCWHLDITEKPAALVGSSRPGRGLGLGQGQGLGPEDYSFNFTLTYCPGAYNSVFSAECPDRVLVRDFVNPFALRR